MMLDELKQDNIAFTFIQRRNDEMMSAFKIHDCIISSLGIPGNFSILQQESCVVENTQLVSLHAEPCFCSSFLCIQDHVVFSRILDFPVSCKLFFRWHVFSLLLLMMTSYQRTLELETQDGKLFPVSKEVHS